MHYFIFFLFCILSLLSIMNKKEYIDFLIYFGVVEVE